MVSLSTSLIIGYTLVWIAANRPRIESRVPNRWGLYAALLLLFLIVGAFASEVEFLIRGVLFQADEYQPFSGGRIYLFNGIIATILGFSFFQNRYFFPQANDLDADEPEEVIEEPEAPILKIPVKQGETILLIAIERIAYFEAFDNYAFVHDLNGEKRLCDYSLRFLDERLPDYFLRVHRKYIVNSQHIQQIDPHLNGRFVLTFASKTLDSITSSKTYAPAIRKLIRID